MARVAAAWERGRRATVDQDYYLDAVALNLHGFHQMAAEVPDVRPAMIGADVAEALDEYRRFRHLVRNIYATNLAPTKMQRLVERLPMLWAQLRGDLATFALFLEQISPEND